MAVADDYQENKEFLPSKQGDFFSNANYRESGISDEAGAVAAIWSDEEQRVQPESTCKDEVRQKSPWTMGGISFRMFQMAVSKGLSLHPQPRMCFDYRNQPSEVERRCLRHAIERKVSLIRFAQVLLESECFTATDYLQLSKSQNDEKWRKIFEIIMKNSRNKQFMSLVQKMIRECGIEQPMQFDLLVANGFPCTCHEQQTAILPQSFNSTLDDGAPSTSKQQELSSSLDPHCHTESGATSGCGMICELGDEPEASVTLESSGVQAAKNVYSDQEKFLNAIHGSFLRIVNPREDGLLDELRVVGAISSDEEQEVDSKATRRDKACKMWTILHHVPARVLGEKCVPILLHKYPHVLMGKTFDWKEQSKLESRCLHHAIRKVLRVRRFADVLPASNACSAAEYKKIISVEDGDESWRTLFDILKQNSRNETLKKSVIEELNNCGIVLPKEFHQLLERGFPCTCKYKRRNGLLCVPPKRRLDEASSQTSYPFSASSGHQNDADSELHSDRSMDQSIQPMTEDGNPTTLEPFDKQEEKGQYCSILDKIDTAIIMASRIKPFIRELEKIQDDILSLKTRARDEESDHLSEAEMQRLTRLLGKAMARHSDIQSLYAAVNEVQISVCDNPKIFRFCVPQYQNKLFLERKHMLKNEIQEAFHFSKSSAKIMQAINFYCQNRFKYM